MTMGWPSETTSIDVREKLDGLRNELVELAFTMECRGHLDAADVALTTAARVAEICEELATERVAIDGAPVVSR